MGFEVASLRNVFVAGDKSIAERLRLRRWRHLLIEFPQIDQMKVLDLGGKTLFWTRAPVRPGSVTVINLKEANEPLPWLRPIAGDALEAPKLLAGETFDLVVSNSLIEHLGGHHQRLRFAEVVRTMAPRFAVQTPNRHFPIEPHWLFPFMQYMPLQAQIKIASHWPLGMTKGWAQDDIQEEVLYTEMISSNQLKHYFPDSRIIVERFAGLVKSMTAIR